MDDQKQEFKDMEWIPFCTGTAESEKPDISDSASTLTTLSAQQDPINNTDGTDGNDSRFNCAECSSFDERHKYTKGNNNKNTNETDNQDCKEDNGYNSPLNTDVQKENYDNGNMLENPTPTCSSCVINPSMNIKEESSVANAMRLSDKSVTIAAIREPIRTRLRSGSISPISYSSLLSFRKSSNSPYDVKGQADHELSRKPAMGKRKLATNSIPPKEVLERILKKRINPTRPCNSYAFFVMANWHAVNYAHPHDSFQDISKKLSKMWSQLSSENKKKFRKLFLRERRRYKKQKEALKRLSIYG